jgi:hypothetical protein
MTERPEPTRYGEAIWLEPFPDVLLEGKLRPLLRELNPGGLALLVGISLAPA